MPIKPTRHVRDMIQIAEREGAEFVALEPGGRCLRLVLKLPNGGCCAFPVPIHGASNPHTLNAFRAKVRRHKP
jgi:hypothetical protein